MFFPDQISYNDYVKGFEDASGKRASENQEEFFHYVMIHISIYNSNQLAVIRSAIARVTDAIEKKL